MSDVAFFVISLYNLENGTWLGAATRQIAARNAIDMLNSMKRKKKLKVGLPHHNGECIPLTAQCVYLSESKDTKSFDYWLHIRSIGNKIILDIPLKSHKHLKKLLSKGILNKSIILTKNFIVVSTDIETGQKRTIGEVIGIDSGFAKDGALATLNTGKKYGSYISKIIDIIDRKQYGSNKQKTKRRYLKNYIDKVAKEIVEQEPKMLVVENLKGLKYKMKERRRLSKTIRRRISNWVYSYWLDRLQQRCEDNRVSFRRVSPWNTSRMCPICNHTDHENRQTRGIFKCQSCGYTDDADKTAAINIRSRGLSGEEFYKNSNKYPLAKLNIMTNPVLGLSGG